MHVLTLFELDRWAICTKLTWLGAPFLADGTIGSIEFLLKTGSEVHLRKLPVSKSSAFRISSVSDPLLRLVRFEIRLGLLLLMVWLVLFMVMDNEDIRGEKRFLVFVPLEYNLSVFFSEEYIWLLREEKGELWCVVWYSNARARYPLCHRVFIGNPAESLFTVSRRHRKSVGDIGKQVNCFRKTWLSET